MVRKLDVSVNVQPYGVQAQPLRGQCARLNIKSRTGEEFAVDLSRAASEALRDQLSDAIDRDGE